MPTSAAEKHLRTRLAELRQSYDALTKRIAALDTDIGRELDSERKLVLEERRSDLVTERDAVLNGISPLEQQLADGTEPASFAEPLPIVQAKVSYSSEEVMVGREQELETLANTWKRARNGTAQAVLVSGEAGIGKTRCIAEFFSRSVGQDAYILTSRAAARPPSAPYQALTELLGPVVAEGAIPAIEEEFLAQVACMVPGLTARCPHSPAPEDIQADRARPRLHWALAAYLAGLCARAPVILFMDDLQWTDEPSLDFLKYFLVQQPTAPVLVVASLRVEDQPNPAYVRRWRTELRSKARLTEINLIPWNEAETHRFVTAWLDIPEAPVFSRRLQAIAEGNPLYLIEILHGLRQQSLLFQDQDGSWSTPFDQTTVDYQELPIPKSIRDLIELRMDNLSAEADAFLKAAAVIGNQFDPEIAQEASELTTDQRDEAVDELATAQLVVAQDLIYCFKHNLHREAVYSAIKPGERRKLHARTGHALLEVIDPSPTLSDIQALADHFYRGEVWDKALTYQLKAGVGALKLYDARTTRRYLQSARRLMERKLRVSVQRVETTPNGFRTRLRQGLVDCFSEEELHTLCFDVGLDYESLPALGKAGKAREIVAYFERINSVSGLVEQCRRLRPNGPWDETPERLQLRQVPIETQLTCLEGLGDAEALLGHFDEARNCYEAALERNPVGGKGRLFVKLADTLYRQAQLDEAADRLQRSFEALEAQPDPSAQSRAHLLMGMIHVQKGEIPQALEETTQALAVESGLAHLLMAIVRRERGELELAITHCQRGIALAEAAKDPVTLAKGHTNLGVLLMDAGRFDEARQTYQRGLEMQAAIGDAFMHALTLCNLAEAHRYLGDLDQSLHLARAGLEGFQKQKSAFGQALAHLNLGEALLEQGEPRKARLEHLEVARRLLEQKGITANLCDVLLAIVECSLAEGVSADAQQAVGRARQVAEKEEDAGDRANALRVLGILRQRQGKRDEAEDALHQSEEAFRALGQRYALGRTRLAQAEFYAADPARLAEARTALDEAREIFEMLGAAQQLKRVQELEPIP